MISRILRTLLVLGALAAMVFVTMNRRNYKSVLPEDLFDFKWVEEVEPAAIETDSLDVIEADTLIEVRS